MTLGRHRKGNGKRRQALGITEVQRSCVACRVKRTATELLRFVRGPEGLLGLDLAKSMPGRGAWLCPKPGCLKHGLQKGAFARALGGAIVSTHESLIEEVQTILVDACKSRLGLAFRAGQLVAGREKVFTGVNENEVKLVICSHDLSERTLRDVSGALLKYPQVPVFVGVDQLATGAAIGRGVTGVLGVSGRDFTGPLTTILSTLNEWMGWSHLSEIKSDLLGTSAPVMGASEPSQIGDVSPQRSV
ncbi:MAG: hypothetical protein CMH56_05535 [Myxococcales bacterium]|nr:hypothetical protein [Myxococcales bacterium]